MTRILESILRDENTVLTVSSVLEGEYNVNDIALSLPSIVNRNGIKRVLTLDIAEKEKEAFIDSANILKDIASKLEL